jgi:hypothetical protein
MTASSLKTVACAFRVRDFRHEPMSFYKFPLAAKPMQMSDSHQVQIRPFAFRSAAAHTGAREASCADFGVGVWGFNPKPDSLKLVQHLSNVTLSTDLVALHLCAAVIINFNEGSSRTSEILCDLISSKNVLRLANADGNSFC